MPTIPSGSFSLSNLIFGARREKQLRAPTMDERIHYLWCCRNSDVEGVEDYLSAPHYGTVNYVPRTSCTGLTEASEYGQDTIVKMLVLEHGGDVNLLNGWGRGPMHMAAQRGRLSTLSLLVELGADVNIKDYRGWTPLMYGKHIPEVVELLVNKLGADPNQEPPPEPIEVEIGG